ncbi:hypothetical protein KVR01_010315 [Diaporthe batatas]|uniref:uncharacterized protein n=1 Tax=Diaporthe batatas TaxID=748121 RepID=UPI001D04FBB1|nr:uncharacterized protein KVR01_010315 [Diaporthe batatas]KAG8159678.1 hypothetical protein KVR01_010315 [Diaporthe batatas]
MVAERFSMHPWRIFAPSRTSPLPDTQESRCLGPYFQLTSIIEESRHPNSRIVKGNGRPQDLVEQLKLFVEHPDTFQANEALKQELLKLSRQAASELESPFETLQGLAYSPLPLVVTRICQDRKIFAALVAASGLQPGVLESIMEYACAQGMAAEAPKGRYVATRLTHTLLVPAFVDGATHFHDNCLPGFSALHHALDGGDAGSNHLPTLLDVVSFETEFAQDLRHDDVVFVDVGGGNGSQCVALKRAFPGLEGRVILQDQPLGARVYYFRQILHNFDDDACVRIQKSQTSALGPDSVVGIDDKVLPDDKPAAGTPGIEYTAALSIKMKVMFDARERRESSLRRLLNQAGLQIKDIRKFTRFDDAVIIATKKPLLD